MYVVVVGGWLVRANKDRVQFCLCRGSPHLVVVLILEM